MNKKLLIIQPKFFIPALPAILEKHGFKEFTNEYRFEKIVSGEELLYLTIKDAIDSEIAFDDKNMMNIIFLKNEFIQHYLFLENS